MGNAAQRFVSAIIFAYQKHKGAVRKGTNTPYIEHPFETMEIVATLTDDPDVICAAVLHDTMEDAHVTYEELEERFGPRVAALVAGESEDKREGLPAEQTWKVRKQEAIDRLRLASRETKIIALGDKLSNMRAIHRDYNKIGDKLWNRFNCKDKAEQGWYYREMLAALDELSETEAWKELKRHVEAVFV